MDEPTKESREEALAMLNEEAVYAVALYSPAVTVLARTLDKLHGRTPVDPLLIEALVETVARAINDATCDDLGCDRDDDWQTWVGEARAAIAAMPPAPQWRTIDSAPRDGTEAEARAALEKRHD